MKLDIRLGSSEKIVILKKSRQKFKSNETNKKFWYKWHCKGKPTTRVDRLDSKFDGIHEKK